MSDHLFEAIESIDPGFALYDKNGTLLIANTKYKELYQAASDLMVPGEVHINQRWYRVSERKTSTDGFVRLLTDITHHVESEEALKRYAEIVESTYEGIISFDLQGVITSWNPACYEIFGWTPLEACGQHISIIYPERLIEDMSEMLHDLRERSPIERHEAQRLKKGGQEVIVSQVITPILGKKNLVLGGSCVVQDITARKRIEEEVKRHDKLLQGINRASHYLLTTEKFFDAIGQAILSVAESCNADMLSVQFEDPKGEMENQRYISRNGTIERTKELVFIPKHWKEKLDLAEPVFQIENFSDYEKHFFVLGDTKTLLLLPFLVHGTYSGFISIENSDVRNWKKSEITLLGAFSNALVGSFAKEVAEEQVKQSEEKFRRIFDTSQDGIIVVNQRGLITLFNPAAEKMFLTDTQSALGQELNIYFPDFSKGARSDGTLFPVEVSASVGEEAGQKVLVVRDITERKRAEQQLALAREREIDIGFRIQHALLLGKPPENLKGITVSLVTIASQGIDGDFYDFFPHTCSEFDLLIGDVMGKGIPAALLGAATKSAFNHAITTLTSTRGKPEPKEILNVVHKQITSQMIDLESFMTIWFARFNNNQKVMTFVDCGHTNTLHFKRKNHEVDQLRGHNVPLGFLEDETYVQSEVHYDYGDVFLFYSDGLTETRNLDGEFYGIDRLKKLLKDIHIEPGDTIVKEVTLAVERFSKAQVFEDDLTVIVVKIEEKGGQLEYLESVDLPKNLDYLETMRRAIVKFSQRAGGPIEPLKVIELELAANEVFTNIVRHSKGIGTDVEIIMEMYLDKIQIHFDYQGERFEPGEVEAPPIDPGAAGGFGLYIIQSMVDEVSYREVEKGWQRVSLTKYLS